MFRIGEFSRIAQTAVSQLRYYNEIGLFQPAHIDPFTGYRYYTASQLPDLNRILALKELGLSLEQIKRMVLDEVSAEEIRGMLALKKAQAEQTIHAEIERLRNIEAHLRQVETDGEMGLDDIIIKEIPESSILSIRSVFPDLSGAAAHVVEMSQLLPSKIPAKKLGHFTAIVHGDAFRTENADVEMGFQLNSAVEESFELSSGHLVSPKPLPYVPSAACAVRVGGFENGYHTYATIGRWVEANGYTLAGLPREVFIVPPNPDRMEETVCEIQFPVALPDQKLLA